MRLAVAVFCAFAALLAASADEHSAITYENPVYPHDHPDPGVLWDSASKLWYVATTGGDAGGNFPIMSSPDLVRWTPAGHIFPSRGGGGPAWAGRGTFWAPELHTNCTGEAKYCAVFVARSDDEGGQLSVGMAFAPSPRGPYTDIGHALVAETEWGNIDPHIFHDGAATYALWKRDGNALGKPTPIFLQRLSPDGRSLLGQPVVTITDDLPWEGGLVEAPWVVKHGGSYYLFYSSNDYSSDRYSISAAVAPSLKGPWKKAGKPLLHSASPPRGWAGPGHCSVLPPVSGVTTNWYIVYHAWAAGHVGGNPGRNILLDELHWPNATAAAAQRGGAAAVVWPVIGRGGAPSTERVPVPH
jgi:beta-xylosidase